MSHTPSDTQDPSQEPSVTDSRTTPRGTPTPAKPGKGLRKSTKLGYLLFLQSKGRLTPGQVAFLLEFQKRVKLEELERAAELLRRLLVSERSAGRAEKELREIQSWCPSLVPKSVHREQRRIGVGYRDKGSLRQPHEDHTAVPRSWWSEDIAPALLSPPEEPRWISADEVMGRSGYHPLEELALNQLLVNSPVYPTLLRFTRRFTPEG